ncbi:MAG: MFS transporter, partial [Thermodesulfobacteriota bacterium]
IYILAVSILFLRVYRLPSPPILRSQNPLGFYRSLKGMGAPIWWISLSWLWYNAGFVSFATFSPPFFIQRGYSLEQSGHLIGIPLLGSLFLSPLIGYIVDRLRNQEWLIGIGGFILCLLTLLFNVSSSFLLLVIVMGIFSALIPSPIYSIPPEILKPENVGVGFGILSTCSSVGLFVAPYLVGKVKDITGSYEWSFILISLFFLLVTIFIFLTYLFRPPKSP